MAGEKKLVNLEALEELARTLQEKLENLDQNTVSGSVYRPAGNLDHPDFLKLTEGNLGNVYNIRNEFTTDSEHYVEGVDKKYPAGTDIAVVEDGPSVYKFNVLSGFVDLQPYAKTTEVVTLIDSTLDAEIVQLSEVQQMLEEVFGDDV